MRDSVKYVVQLSAVTLAILSGNASAVGFGEINLLSRIGEPLRAEVELIGTDGRNETACFSLAPLRDADMPVVTSANIKLYKQGTSHRLLITSPRAIADPVFILALRAGCGVELQRDFVLMPSPPVQSAAAPPLQAATTLSSPGDSTRSGKPPREWKANAGDTLESIAESLAPDDVVRQRRMKDALQRANPQLDPDYPIPEGTAVRVPSLRKQAARETVPSQENASPPPRRPTSEPRERTTPRPAPERAKTGGDRVVLGAPPADLKPDEKAVPPRGSLPDMEDRMLKMEYTLRQLNEEVAKLNQALALTSEIVATQEKLKAAQALQTPTAAPAATTTQAPAPARSTSSNFLELAISALAGGAIAGLFAHYLAGRRQQQEENGRRLARVSARATARASTHATPHQAGAAVFAQREPIASSAVSPPVTRESPTFVTSEKSAAPPANQEVDIPLAPLSDFSAGSEENLLDVTEDNSVLELAEMMLTFGRLKGATDTLANYIEGSNPSQIQPWLMLLDLYRRADLRAEFDTLAPRIADQFNVCPPEWEHGLVTLKGLKTLEDFPHILDRIRAKWGTQACLDYLYDLVRDKRDGKRIGFPLEVVEEIALLMRVQEDAYHLKRAD